MYEGLTGKSFWVTGMFWRLRRAMALAERYSEGLFTVNGELALSLNNTKYRGLLWPKLQFSPKQ
jgi:hypothetical protein